MNSKEIAAMIGKRVWLRKVGYQLIYWTTLREWYIKNGLKRYRGSATGEPAVLDAGCGLGQHLYYCAQAHPEARVLGLEQDPQQVEDLAHFLQAERLPHARVECTDLTTWNCQDAYDVVLCGSVLEHIREDLVVLKKLAAALKPGGHLLLYVPSAERRVLPWLERRMQDDLRRSGKKYPHEHVRYYAPQELSVKVRSVGLQIVEQRITYGRWGRWAYDAVTSVQVCRFFKWIFPFYLFFVHPWVLVMMWMDTRSKNRTGNGLWMVACKPI
ncbi:MAG TPA: class I SAM-dependent methyltransferase [bacterium]|mgnify:CR=1 FL=1|nr:class I SAM-dependent methyltransferase [bacterium]